MFKSYQRETKLFEFSQNRETLKIRNVTLQWLDFAMTWRHFANDYVNFTKAVCKYSINKDVYLWFCSSLLSMFTNKAAIFLDDGLYRQISVRCQGVLNQWKYIISVKLQLYYRVPWNFIDHQTFPNPLS